MSDWPRLRGIDHVTFECEPRAGATIAVRSARPISAQSVWTVYRPIEAEINGWEEYPEQLLQSCLVRVKPARVDRAGDSFEARVLVEESIALPALASYFGAPSEGRAPALPPNRTELAIKDFKLVTGNLESDVTGYLIIQRIASEEILLLHGYSDFEESIIEAGAMRLTSY